MERAISLLGLFVMIGLAWLMSSHKRKINLRIVGAGLLLQFVLALLILKTVPGRYVFRRIGDFFNAVMNSVDAGSSMVFGENFSDFYFAFKVLPTIIFFSSLMAVLYHLGIVQKVVRGCAFVMQRTLRTSGAESLAAAANIFVGQTEAPLVIRPYISQMTNSELMAVMVGGFATIAGGLLAAFVGLGIDAGHLVAASVISAPAALLIAKVIMPETEVSKTMGTVQIEVERKCVNVIEAAATGATDGLKLALNVAAMLIAFLAMIALFDAAIGLAGTQFGYDGDQKWKLATFLGYLFYPLAWVMGIEKGDCYHAGQLLGLKMAANEFVAYKELADFMQKDSGVELSSRSIQILTYALCGFANFGSIGIQIGGIGGIAPDRRGDLARLGFRAMLGGTLAAFMTACIAGILI
jgi:CNT family concentrative nucleoside transporter